MGQIWANASMLESLADGQSTPREANQFKVAKA